jgi:hypothetical protein
MINMENIKVGEIVYLNMNSICGNLFICEIMQISDRFIHVRYVSHIRDGVIHHQYTQFSKQAYNRIYEKLEYNPISAFVSCIKKGKI